MRRQESGTNREAAPEMWRSSSGGRRADRSVFGWRGGLRAGFVTSLPGGFGAPPRG
jgi:hypothetical protein